MSALSHRVGRSVAWSAAGAAIMRVGQLLVGIIAARLLAPEQFGVFAVTLVVYSIVVNVSELGVASALIRSPDSIDELAPTAATVSMVTAAVLAGVMAATAPAVAGAFGVSQAAGPIVVMSLVVLLAGPSAVPAALLTSRFRQDRRLVADGFNFLCSNGLLLVLAQHGDGAYALAWSRVAGQLVSVVVLLCVVHRRHRPGFRPAAFRYLVALGLPLVGANLIGYAVNSLDVVLVGHLLGAVQLGIYNLALNVSSWPVQLLTPVLVNVGLPLVSLFQSDRRRLGEVVFALVAATAVVFLPVLAMIAVLSHQLVLALYGAAWVGAGPVLAVMSVAGGVRVLLALLSDVLVAANSTGTLLAIQLAWLVVLCPAVAVGIHVDGAVGAALGVAGCMTLVVLPLTVIACRRHAAVPLSRMATSVARPLLTAVAAAALAGLVVLVLGRHPVPALVTLVVAGSAGVLVYGVLIRRHAGVAVSRIRSLIDRGRGTDQIGDQAGHERPVMRPVAMEATG